MRRLTAILCSLALIACGSESPVEPGDVGVAQSVEIIEGDGQTVQVTETTDTIRVVVRDDSDQPVPGDLVSYETDGPSECGNWETSTLSSDQSGEARNVIHAGTVADTRTDVSCTFRVVHSAQGAPEPLVDSARVEVLPGTAVDTVEAATLNAGPPPFTTPADWLVDQHGNPVPYRWVADSVVAASADSVGEQGRTLEVAADGGPGDEAVACAHDGSGGFLFPARVQVGDDEIRVTVTWDSGESGPTEPGFGPEQCTNS